MTFDAQVFAQLTFAFLVALMGALMGGAVRWSEVRRERRLRLTLELYGEFHSPMFNHIRILAHEALTKGGALPDAYKASEGEAKEAIASIVHFWEKVALLSRMGALNDHLTRRCFGQYARWWAPLLCDKQGALSDDEWGQTLRDIHWLFERLKRTQRAGSRK